MAQSLKWEGHGIGRWRRHALPLLVWLMAVAAAGGLFVHRSSSSELTGIARAEQREVAALADGRLRLVPVDLFESVKEGQALAVLEDDRIQASLATAAAEVSRLQAELAATENRLVVDSAIQQAQEMAETRRYAVDIERNRLREIELQVAIETNCIRLEFLRLQKDLLGNLRGQHAVSELRFRSAEAEYNALEKSTSENRKAIAQVRLDLEQARRRMESFTQNHAEPRAIDKALEPLRAAVTVQQRRIAELSLDRSMLVLKSPMDGVVSRVLRGAGESVRTGEPILTVASTRPAVAIAYATPAQAARFGAGLPVRLAVVREGGPGRAVDTEVRAVGPTVEQIPARLWRSPSVPEWGWPVKVAIPPELGVLCGEVVGVARP